MDLFCPGASGLFAIFAWLVGVTVGAVVLSILLRPLDAPGNSKKSRWAETFLSFIVGGLLFTIFFSNLAVSLIFSLIFLLIPLGPLAILPILALLFLGKENKPQQPQEPVTLKYSLMELIAMALAIGFSPIMIGWLYSVPLESSASTILIVALVAGPVLYMRALYRLNANHVPFGTMRTAFLLVYPYMVYACLYFFARSSLLAMAYCFDSHGTSPDQLSKLYGAALITAAGIFLTREAKSEAPETQTAELKE